MALHLEFRVCVRASYGAHLILLGSTAFLGEWKPPRALHCAWTDGHVWSVRVNYTQKHAAPSRFEFKFAIVDHKDNIVEWEPGPNHAINLPAFPAQRILVDVHWAAAQELDFCRSPAHISSQSPPPTPASQPLSDSNSDGDHLCRAVARLAVSQSSNPHPLPNGANAHQTAENSLSHLVPVQFRIKYRVEDGERIYVIGGIPELGQWNKMHAPRLVQPPADEQVVETGLWVLNMHIPRDILHTQFEYKYFTRKGDGSRRWESGDNRLARPFDGTAPKDISSDRVVWDDRWEKVRVEFSIYYPTNDAEVMHVTGDPPEIGAWFKPGPTPMKLGAVQTLETDVKGRKWYLSIWVNPTISSFSYRYIVIDSKSKRSLWEREPNRKAAIDSDKRMSNSALILRDVNFVSGMQFDAVPPSMFIGPYPQTVDDIDALVREGITAVFNVQTDEDFSHRGVQWNLLMERYRFHNVQVVRYPIRDFDRDSLRARLPGAIRELDSLISNGKQVYIHCTAGMGRAPACAVAYLCRIRKMTLDNAVAHVKKHRVVAVPNVPVLRDVLKQEVCRLPQTN